MTKSGVQSNSISTKRSLPAVAHSSNTFDSFLHTAHQRHAQNARRKERNTGDLERSCLVETGLLVGAIGEVVGAGEGVLVVRHVSAALETLHLPRLQLAEVLLAGVDAADLVADDVGLDVLLCLGLGRC